MISRSYVIKRPAISLLQGKGLLLRALDIELTERCNNNCLHCYINLSTDDSDARKKELSADKIKNILKEAQSLGCLRAMLTGGEPLLREDFEELYVFTRKLGLKAVIFTNATLITPRLAKLFSRVPPLEKIEVSVYGMNKGSYEAVTRVAGSFASFRQGVNLLLRNKVPFRIKSALLPPNRHEIKELEVWAKGIPRMDNPPSYSMFFNLRCRRDSPDKNELIRSLRVPAQEGLKILTRRRNKYRKEMEEFCSKFMKPAGDKLFSCGAGCGGGCVDAYGNFQLCMLLRSPDTTYDLKKGTLKDALINFFPKIREIKAANPEYLERCARCFLKGLCDQCPGKSWMEHGTLDTPVEYLCEIAHTQARFLGLLNKNEKSWERMSE